MFMIGLYCSSCWSFLNFNLHGQVVDEVGDGMQRNAKTDGEEGRGSLMSTEINTCF